MNSHSDHSVVATPEHAAATFQIKYRRPIAVGALVGAGFNFGGSLWSFASQPLLTTVSIAVGLAALLWGIGLLYADSEAA